MKTITVPGFYKNLAIICEFVHQAAVDAGLNDKAVYEVETAVDEAVCNIIDHAYGGEGDGKVECSYEISDAGLIIHLRDFGKSFNPAKVKHPNLKAPLGKRKDRGLGLYMMRQWMDEVRFEFSQSAGNLLTMVKRREGNT
jgi:serine/threonine-protein kinase RsbW